MTCQAGTTVCVCVLSMTPAVSGPSTLAAESKEQPSTNNASQHDI